MKTGLKIFLAGLLGISLIAASWQPIMEAFWLNRLTIQVQKALLTDPARLSTVYDELEPAASRNCRLQWHLGVVAGKMGDFEAQQDAWSSFMECYPERALSLVRAAAPQHVELAQLAVEQHPERADSWFWLADIRMDDNPAEAIPLYSAGLEIDPTHGLAWCRLGMLQEAAGALISAEEAYIQCCLNGDPGSHGCWGAGRMAEGRGDIERAVRFYRASSWQTSKERGEELNRLNK